MKIFQKALLLYPTQHVVEEDEVELALEAAWYAGYQGGRAWAEESGRKEPPRLTPSQEANIKLVNSVGQSLAAMGQALEGVAHLVDNMGRLP